MKSLTASYGMAAPEYDCECPRCGLDFDLWELPVGRSCPRCGDEPSGIPVCPSDEDVENAT